MEKEKSVLNKVYQQFENMSACLAAVSSSFGSPVPGSNLGRGGGGGGGLPTVRSERQQIALFIMYKIKVINNKVGGKRRRKYVKKKNVCL